MFCFLLQTELLPLISSVDLYNQANQYYRTNIYILPTTTKPDLQTIYTIHVIHPYINVCVFSFQILNKVECFIIMKLSGFYLAFCLIFHFNCLCRWFQRRYFRRQNCWRESCLSVCLCQLVTLIYITFMDVSRDLSTKFEIALKVILLLVVNVTHNSFTTHTQQLQLISLSFKWIVCGCVFPLLGKHNISMVVVVNWLKYY